MRKLRDEVGRPYYIERIERKYEVGISEVGLPALRHDVNQYLPTYEFVPGQPITINSTLYFDNDNLLFLKRGLENKAEHTRIRARRYEYDSTPGDEPACYWIEFRARKGEVRAKRRLKVGNEDLQKLLEGRKIDEKVLQDNLPYGDSEQCKALYRDIQCTVVANKLKPVLLVRYRRMAFELGEVRLTLDWDIRYYQSSRAILYGAWLKDLAESQCGEERDMILELKNQGKPPHWMSHLQQKYPIKISACFSKLDRGMRALLEGPLRSRPDAESLLDKIFESETL